MDRYINKNPDNNLGLDLLVDLKKMRKRDILQVDNIQFRTKLNDFKDYLRSKIDRFNPMLEGDTVDSFIRNIWFHYLLNKSTKEKQILIYNSLKIDNYSNDNYSNDNYNNHIELDK